MRWLVLCVLVAGVSCQYWQTRFDFLGTEGLMSLGSNLTLTPKEVQVNEVLMAAKRGDYNRGVQDPSTFPPAKHFFLSKSDIERSTVFGIIRKMPKGAVLHGHDSSMVSPDFLVSNLTYMPHLYVCTNGSVQLFHFFLHPDNSCDWQLLSELRHNASNVTELDQELRAQMTLFTTTPSERYPDNGVVWTEFFRLFDTEKGLVFYRPAFETYLYELLSEFYNDNVFYLELRCDLNAVFELDGTVLPPRDVVYLYKNVTARFTEDHPDFLGIRLIYTASRFLDDASMQQYISSVVALKREFPEFIAGFDIAAYENLGRPLRDFVPLLLPVRQDIKFFFHAGETDWQGMADLNLVDAILLNTTRIGHGYAVTKHPLVMQVVKQRDIALEVNPVSNQVLMLLDDLRNHPAASLMAQNYPIVISSDNSGFWETTGLSYDFYEAFMAFAGLDGDLRVLKQLAVNSIRYSAMEEAEKENATELFNRKWGEFLDQVLDGCGR